MSCLTGGNPSREFRLPYVNVTIGKKGGRSTLAGNSFSPAHNNSTRSAVDCQSQSTNFSVSNSNQMNFSHSTTKEEARQDVTT
jgi:hypothetical protein